jgi:hypothetical protein
MKTTTHEAVVARRSAAGDLLGLLTISLYAASFFLPATRDFMGYQAFVYSLVCMVFIPMWAANLALWLGLAELSLGRYRRAGLAGLVALVLVASECWLFVGELRAGFFAWVGSMVLLALVGLCGAEQNRPRWPVQVGTNFAGEASRIASRFPAVAPCPRSLIGPAACRRSRPTA